MQTPTRDSTALRACLLRSPFQAVAALLCLLFGIAMVVNVQMGGEAMWFWYGYEFLHGARLYADLHLALQPLYVLETSAWTRLVGVNIWATEVPSLVHIALYVAAIALIVRETDWPEALKGLLLAAAFVLSVSGNAYRFDDYRAISESSFLLALACLLWLPRARSLARQLGLCVSIGVLSAIAITTRINDGGAFVVAATICAMVLVQRQRLASGAVLLLVTCLAWLLIVRLTGDSLRDYVANSILKAAGSKGGSSSFLLRPFVLPVHALSDFISGGKKIFAVFLLALGLGAAGAWRWRKGMAAAIAYQALLLAATFLLVPAGTRRTIVDGEMITLLVLLGIVLTYLVLPALAAREAYRALRGPDRSTPRDPRLTLFLIPLAEWASSAIASSAEPLTQFWAPVAMFLLIAAVVIPYRRIPEWGRACWSTTLLVLVASGITHKAVSPYSWQNYVEPPMFTQRTWFQHPIYGRLYIDKDLLTFSRAVCTDIGDADLTGRSHPELLSLPYPFPNYFCATPPWRGYVQTFFDTSTRATIDDLMHQLTTAPPQYIVYQRQLGILKGAEHLYNHDRPLAHRDLDTLIMHKLATGEWTLMERRDYLKGDGWYIVQTHP